MASKVVSVFGTSRAKPGQPLFDLAQETGRVLAQAGFTVANGGYGGTMLATAQGAVRAGGTVIGVTCRAFKNSVANEYVTREVVTDSLQERLGNLIKAADAYVVLPGGTGTLLELASVWELKNKKFFGVSKPIVLMGDFWRPLVNLMDSDDPRAAQSVVLARTPAEAVKHIEEALGGLDEGGADE